MNNLKHKGAPLLTRTFGLIILMVFCNMAAAINSQVKADTVQPDIECLFNYAQTFYPSLFSPPVSDLQFFSPYTYRYYPATNSYVGVSSADNHVYYLGPGVLLQDAQDAGDLSAWLKESGCGARPYPLIFIQGIASTADTWIPFRDYLINNAGLTFGGTLTPTRALNDRITVDISCPSGSSPPVACTCSSGDFYTLNFSSVEPFYNAQDLPLDVQGGELSAIITAVLDENPGATNVLLAGHSSGGLAAREYLQGLARKEFFSSFPATTIPYRKDVAKLITVGTPHQGSFWAEACHLHFDIVDISGNVGICDLLSLDIDPNSIAVEELQPNSSALNNLNNLVAHPLPSDVSYVSIKGKGQPTLAGFTVLEPNLVSLGFLVGLDFTTGDGIVSDTSQNLMTVAGDLPLQQTVSIDISFRECGNKIAFKVPVIGNVDVGQTHTCEPTELGVWAEILRNLEQAVV